MSSFSSELAAQEDRGLVPHQNQEVAPSTRTTESPQCRPNDDPHRGEGKQREDVAASSTLAAPLPLREEVEAAVEGLINLS